MKGFAAISRKPSLHESHSSSSCLTNYSKILCCKVAGTAVIDKLFQKMTTDIEKPEKHTIKSSGTISEWEERDLVIESDNISKKETGLFLTKDLGFLPLNKKPLKTNNKKILTIKRLTENAFEKISQSDIITIYNISDDKYFDESFSLSNLNIKEHALILFKTKFNPKMKYTEFFNTFCEEIKLVSKTILLVTTDDLRRGGLDVKKGLSWEQLIHETATALQSIKHYDKFGAIVVCFDYEGCLIYLNGTITSFFYPAEIEGDSILRGIQKYGAGTTMQVSLAWALLQANFNKVPAVDNLKCALEQGVKTGLVAMRHLMENGFDSCKMDFPYESIAHTIKEQCVVLVQKTIPSDIAHFEINMSDMQKGFSIINTHIRAKNANIEQAVFDICKEIVCFGKTDTNIPYLRYNDLVSYDRFEIEQFRNIHHLFHTYVCDTNVNKPFSIGIFGSPGSGKSFAVNQIIASIAEMKLENAIKISEPITFNVSQMNEIDELITVFHQIRDARIKGECPIVFFDEFDAEKLKWVKHFLAPMQDGKFAYKGQLHVIGRAIFIFAGGTNSSLNVFKDKAAEPDSKDLKVPDFLSRLKGYINILEPNIECTDNKFILDGSITPSTVCSECTSKSDGVQCKVCSNRCHRCNSANLFCRYSHMIRRATLLRSLLKNKLNKKGKNKDDSNIQIDDEVLRAFIQCDKYLNGVRSLEAIIQTCDITPKIENFSASCINTVGLDMYVDNSFILKLNSKK